MADIHGGREVTSDSKRAKHAQPTACLSPVLYLLGICAAFVHTGVAQANYASVAEIWLIPECRIETKLAETEGASRDQSAESIVHARTLAARR